MNRSLAFLVASLLGSVAFAGAATAQNLVISNARIIVGNGQVIENGSIVVKDGKIASVAPGAPPAGAAGTKIDAKGLTAIAGFIDDHRHLTTQVRGGNIDAFLKDAAPKEMMELLESGVTSVQEGGGNDEAILKLETAVASGQIKGPRIFASGRVQVDKPISEADLRAQVDKVFNAGADSIAEVHFPAAEPPNPPTEVETKNLSIAIDEAKKFGKHFQVHATSPDAMIAAVRAGAKKLVHTPHHDWVTEAQAKEVKDAGAWVSSCTGFGAPVFDVFNHDNKPTFRDGGAWPSAILHGQGQGREAGYKPVNGRTLFDGGVDYGYCTDTNYNASAGLAQELKVLNLTFSPIDMVKILGQNSADFIDRGKDLGTLEVGKLGDIVLLNGNPLEAYWYFLTTTVVAKEGVVLVDKRKNPPHATFLGASGTATVEKK